MTTFCLIHGKWHDGSSWDPLAERLQAAGHHVAAPNLPYDDPETSYADRIAPALAAVADAEPPVVVVGHSYAAGYAPIVAGMVSASALVYLCPAPLGPFADAGAPMRAARLAFQFPPDRPDGTSVWVPEVAVAQMYPHLPAEAAWTLARRLRPGASPRDSYPLDAQPELATAFIYAAHDEFFEPEWSRWVAREVAGVEPVELETGHFPMVEAPGALAEVLVGTLAPTAPG